jgi:hypothetical protein
MEFSMAYHPQTDGQTKRLNRVIEGMLQMHFMHRPKQWEEYLTLVEFAYENGYQESLRMILFEALYGRKCRISVSWDSPVDNAEGNGESHSSDKTEPENCSG